MILHNRGGLFDFAPGKVNSLGPRKRPQTTIIPAFMEKGDVKIGFGIMGGFNQAQAHAQFVSNIVDFGFNIQAAVEAPRFTKGTFDGCDVSIESRVPEAVRNQLTAWGHQLRVTEPIFGDHGPGQCRDGGWKRSEVRSVGSPRGRRGGAAVAADFLEALAKFARAIADISLMFRGRA